MPTLVESGVSAAPLITAHFVLGPAAAIRHGRPPRCGRAACGKSTEFKQEMERLLIVGGLRSPAETRELMLQAEAQYVQFVRETGASID